jgi:hypothetical protein
LSFGRQLQTSQRNMIGGRKPSQHAAARARANHLLDRPKTVFAARVHEQQCVDADASLLQRGRVGDERRRDPSDPLSRRSESTTRGQRRESRHQQRELADAVALDEHFDERT